MDWDKEELKEQIESNIDWWWEEIEFAKSLLGILEKAPTGEAFMSIARQEAEKHYDIWIRDDLCSFVDNLETVS
jgi:hypothetical protein